ncbi:MAG TPA: adenylosuccinate lyase family protein, partial [Mycobacteriales bacterium]|nr:adenylosuccinate lyase family protein [Mycobacteriales bacterium]
SERDGRSWKAEWVALPEVCLLTTTATALAVDLLQGLEVDTGAMQRNLDGWTGSEQALALLTPRLGKHAAQAALHDALRDGRAAGRTLGESLRALLPEAEHLQPDAGLAGEMVDVVVARARQDRR